MVITIQWHGTMNMMVAVHFILSLGIQMNHFRT